jgi:hypothetical protein
VETMVKREPPSSPLTASPNLVHERRSTALLERRARARLRVREVVVTLTLLPSSSRRYSITVRRPPASGPRTTRGGRRRPRSSSSSAHWNLCGCCVATAAAMGLSRTPRAPGLWGCVVTGEVGRASVWFRLQIGGP